MDRNAVKYKFSTFLFSISDSENKLCSHNQLQPSNQYQLHQHVGYRVEIEFLTFRFSLVRKSYPNPENNHKTIESSKSLKHTLKLSAIAFRHDPTHFPTSTNPSSVVFDNIANDS